jgi:hypothetical protein
MTEQERKNQEEKDRYRFGAYHWEDKGKSESNNPTDDYYTVPVNPDYEKPEPIWWGKKATSEQPL